VDLPPLKEAYSSEVNEITLGGNGRKTVTIGGARTVPYGGEREATGHWPRIAVDVLDAAPTDWPTVLADAYQDVLDDPAAWAKMAVDEIGADLVCIKFEGIDPDAGDRDAAHAVQVTKKVLEAVDVPVVLWGCGNNEKDNEVMPKVSEAAKGASVLLGTVTEDNYNPSSATAATRPGGARRPRPRPTISPNGATRPAAGHSGRPSPRSTCSSRASTSFACGIPRPSHGSRRGSTACGGRRRRAVSAPDMSF